MLPILRSLRSLDPMLPILRSLRSLDPMLPVSGPLLGYDRPVQRWEPDELLMAAVLAGSKRTMSDLSPPDRCWLVAGLTLARLTAEDIADRMRCSLRLVRTIRAEDMTQVCIRMQEETAHFTNEVRLARSEHRAAIAALDRMTGERDRLRVQLDRLLDAHLVGDNPCPRCGTPVAGYNAYVWRERTFCRECHRRRNAAYRARSKGSPVDV